MMNCFPWSWERCKSLCRWGRRHAQTTQPYKDGTAKQNKTPTRRRELEPLLESQRAQTARNNYGGNDTPAASPTEHGQDENEDEDDSPIQERILRREPSISVIPASRSNTLDDAAWAAMDTPTPSRESDGNVMITTGYSTKLDIPKDLSQTATAEEETNVSPSSIHSSGSNRALNLDALTETELLGIGRYFTGAEIQPSDSDEHMEDELSPKQKLEDQFLDQLIEWPKNENKYFIPIDQQKRIVTFKSIMEELRRVEVENRDNRHSEGEIIDAMKKIWEHAPKLFSILVCLGKGKCIYNFLKEGLTDEDLPFVRSTSEADAHATGAGRFKLSSRRTPHIPIRSMAKWSRHDITGFGRDQWWMLAPVFKESKKVRHYELDDMCVMPFIEDHERTNTIASGFSTVWAVRIHPAHQLLNTSNTKNRNPLIALKKLNSTDKKDFRLEVEMLKAFSNHKNRHLIKLLATYRLKNRYHLMFPHCKYNLRTYWEANPQPMFTSTNVRWFLSQCKGIANGLMTIHEYRSSEAENAAKLSELGRSRHGNTLGVNPIPVKEDERIYGRHGDIKPENILWSDDTDSDTDCASTQELEQIGLLVIADFGLMDFHGKQSRSMVQADVPASLTYAPPELRLKISISRAYDIWSLGCVYLEFVTWLVSWYDELDWFPNARGLTGASGVNDDLYYTIIDEKDGTSRAIVRESVTEWMKDLHEKSRCSQFIHDFVDLISEEMLVVDQNKRIHCGPLNSRLQEMCARSKQDPGYLTEPKPFLPRERNSVAENISRAGRSGRGKDEGSPTSPTATEGKLLPTKNEIPADLDTTTKSPKLRAANPPSRPISVRLRSPSPAGLRSSSPRPSIFLTEVDQGEGRSSQIFGDDT